MRVPPPVLLLLLLFCFSHQFSGYPAGPLAALLYWEKVHERSWAGHGDVWAVKSSS